MFYIFFVMEWRFINMARHFWGWTLKNSNVVCCIINFFLHSRTIGIELDKKNFTGFTLKIMEIQWYVPCFYRQTFYFWVFLLSNEINTKYLFNFFFNFTLCCLLILQCNYLHDQLQNEHCLLHVLAKRAQFFFDSAILFDILFGVLRCTKTIRNRVEC